ncbi:MAG: sn-glycerol-3-phosphate ABC transporter ATP-binding protein UgpC [Candidatus Edwardsbacteria bacterium]
MSQVVLKEVTKIFESKVVAVKDVNLTIEDKEFVVLVGPSGCGKTTILRLIAGLDEVTKGEIYIDRKLVNGLPPKDRGIAMVFQNYALYPHMTVYDNLAFALKLQKYPKNQIEQKVNETARILGISHLLNRKPRTLSGGQQQRVAVGRAIVRNPKVFLFDEPLSNLDAKVRGQMRTELLKLHGKLSTTIIYVTHDQLEAMSMGDRIIVMKEGIVQQIGKPLDVYKKPSNKFVAGFIGSPAMNFFEAKITKGDENFLFAGEDFSWSLPSEKKFYSYLDRKIVCGIRPEDLNENTSEQTTALFFLKIKATVEIVEPIGNEIYLTLIAGKTSFIARIEAEKEPKYGEEVELIVNTEKIHFFDPETEEAIL